jgi:FAS-associated factor 2
MFFSTLFNAQPPITGAESARRFVQGYEERYRGRGGPPPFVTGGYKRAASQAREESKLLLVYLHSPLHQDTDEFCEQTLSSSDVLNAIRDGYCFWGGSVEYPEPYMLMNEHIKPSAFPSLSVRVLYII